MEKKFPARAFKGHTYHPYIHIDNIIPDFALFIPNWRANEASETVLGVNNTVSHIYIYIIASLARQLVMCLSTNGEFINYVCGKGVQCHSNHSCNCLN